jgi:hypothetical protein
MLVTVAPLESIKLAAMVTAEVPAPVEEKSVLPVATALETVAVAVRLTAPLDELADGAMPTLATPELSVSAVLELKVAMVELRVKVTSLLAMAAPDPSNKVALAE